MNPANDPLDRLLKAAAGAPKPAAGAARFALESRVMSEWRGSDAAEGGEFILVWLRRAAIAACVLALASVAWDFRQLADPAGDELAGADFAMRMGVEQ